MGREWSSRERMEAAVRGEEPDRVPVWPQIYAYAPRVCGMLFSQYCTGSRNLVKAQLEALELFGYDAVGAYPDITIEAEAIGSRVHVPRDEIPEVREPLVVDPSDLDSLHFPDPRQDGRMPMVLDSIRMLVEKTRGELMVFSGFQGPFSLCCHLRGLSQFIVDLYTNQSFARDMLKIVKEILMTYAEAQIAAGAHVIEIGDSSSQMLSPHQFREFAFPPLEEVMAAIDSQGALSALHICGDTNHILDDMARSGAHLLELDTAVNLSEAKQRVGNRVCILGNLDPVGVLLQRTEREVIEGSLSLITSTAPGGGYILSAGCEPPLATPSENIRAMVDACRRFGAYPIRRLEA
ncbi:MAG: uroporphyrinogen decarboxylase family protein [Aigarchaeota archaeon]|nr:uroporphyrinogen decarboxylase family protein [Aigarchaeota archaeon]MDH5703541.1 uroporphyrinogen decarboxylase family protein [Aigarchaeota archaeon]